MINSTIMNAMLIANPIQSGESTHHHDQSILPINFKKMNRIVSKLVKPIPEDVELDALDAITLFFQFVNVFFKDKAQICLSELF
jgi:hypothetical protein